MKLKVVDERKEPIAEPYVLRLGGWTLERFVFRLLAGCCEARGWGKVLMGPAAIRILPDVVRDPDVFVVPPEEVQKARGVPLDLRPALVVEVVSPATRTMDLGEKAEEYRQAEPAGGEGSAHEPAGKGARGLGWTDRLSWGTMLVRGPWG